MKTKFPFLKFVKVLTYRYSFSANLAVTFSIAELALKL